MRTEKPIFDIITENMVDGRLPDDFAIRDDGFQGDPRLRMAPGAMDGICIYHMGPAELSDEGRKMIACAVQAAAAGDDNAYELFEALGDKYRAVTIIDDVQQYILEHANELNQGELLRFSVEELIFRSRTLECVKYGLVITELYGDFSDDHKWIFRQLGLYDEFTIFVVFNMKRWEKGNKEIFELAQKVDSWGKIHAVHHLEPSTQEIRDWILYKGMDNGVMDEYLALTCFRKSGAAERLKGRPTNDEFSAVSHILLHLFDEGPVPGISALQDTEETLGHYLSHADRMELGLEDYKAILGIRDYAENEKMAQLAEHANRLLHSEKCIACVTNAVTKGDGIDLAKALEIPFRDQLLQLMKNDFNRAYCWCNELMEDPDYVEPVLAIFREKAPPEKLEQGPRDEFGFGENYETDQQINYMLQNLDDYPGKGTDYLLRAISAPTIRSRFLTVRILKAWVSEAGKPLQDCYPELYTRLAEAYPAEFREDLKADMKCLLEGATVFSDEKNMTEDEA